MKRKICPVCELGELIDVDDILSQIEGYTFVEKGRRCLKCLEEFISEEEGERTIKVARRLGIWGEPLKLHRKLSKSARGTVLRIPEDIREEMHIQGNEEVLVSKIGENKLLVEVVVEA